MSEHQRLTSSQIVLLRSLVRRGGATRAITLDYRWQRKPALPLWRRGLLEVWYRQTPSEVPSLQGPYYALTVIGAQLASSFVTPGASRDLGAFEERP